MGDLHNKMKTDKIMELIEKCNHWQPDFNFACVDKEKLKDLLIKEENR